MIAQDTGSAIVGPARADIYFGAGDEPAASPAASSSPGSFVMLVPRELDPVEAGADMPLPTAAAGHRRCRSRGAGRSRRRSRRNDQREPAPRRPTPKPRAMSTCRRARRHAGAACSAHDERALWTTVTRVDRAAARARPARAATTEAKPLRRQPRRAVAKAAHAAARAAKSAKRAAAARPRRRRWPPLGRRMKQRVARGTRADRRAARSARLTQGEAHAALLRFCAARSAREREAGAGHHRQGRAAATASAACCKPPGAAVARAAGIPRAGGRLRGRAYRATAARARSMCGCGGRAAA